MGYAHAMRGCPHYVCALVVSAVTDEAPRCFLSTRFTGGVFFRKPFGLGPKHRTPYLDRVAPFFQQAYVFGMLPIERAILFPAHQGNVVFCFLVPPIVFVETV